MISEAIKKLVKFQDLTYEEALNCMDEIMSGETTDIQTSAFLTSLAMKNETVEEITACAAGMRKHCVKVLDEQDVLEIVGTGGDGSNTFNISSTSSLVIASAGVPVAKHGNRAASSKSGAADCFEALGVQITLPPEASKQMIDDIDICFLFAQNHHLAMKYVAPVRRELGIRTVFNIIGPLTNPAGAQMELMGVYEEALVEPLTRVMANLGVRRAMTVFGQDVLDEISPSAPTTVCEDFGDGMHTYEICPEDFGLERCRKEDIVGGTPAENAQITRDILAGEKGPRRTAVLMNSGAAMYVAGKVDSIAEGVELAASLIDSGAAQAKLQQMIDLSQQLSAQAAR